jgi:hypothetical protein
VASIEKGIAVLALVPFLEAGISTPLAMAHPQSGFLYGTVETSGDKTYTGLLRWGGEESFWDDLFNSAKARLPYMDHLPREERSHRSRIEIFGFDVGYRWNEDYASRQFIARFGDIEEIRVHGRETADVVIKGGEIFPVKGASNDIGAEIQVEDPELGDVVIPWRRIDRIRFQATPPSVKPDGTRLYGSLYAEDERFDGFIQWDSQECLTTDRLDGSSEDGKMSIPMGRIASIEKHGRDRCRVHLKDGRQVVLGESNDVDASLRGVFVEDSRYGRVKVSWESFDRVEFGDAPGSGLGFEDYAAARPLSGSVTDEEGGERRGKLVIDLDESRSWEFLNGDRFGVEFFVPFGAVKSIIPRGGSSSRIVMRSGLEVVLEDAKDVSESNDGVVILKGQKDEGTYIRWRDVERIDFD